MLQALFSSKTKWSGWKNKITKVTSVKLSSGDTIACGAVVNCAGPAAASIASMLGIPLPIEARKRTVFVIDCKTPHPDMPLMVDTSGVYIRPEGNYFISGVCPSSEEDIPVGPDDLDPHYDLFEEMIWPSLYNRMPGFDAIKWSMLGRPL